MHLLNRKVRGNPRCYFKCPMWVVLCFIN